MPALELALAQPIDEIVLVGCVELGEAADDDGPWSAHAELELLARRTRLVYAAIVLAVLSALFICLLIAVAFLDAFIQANLAAVLGVLFVLAMIALIGCLLVFLREIFLAVRMTRRVAERASQLEGA